LLLPWPPNIFRPFVTFLKWRDSDAALPDLADDAELRSDVEELSLYKRSTPIRKERGLKMNPLIAGNDRPRQLE
jgi:hypothetical protein